MLPLYWLFLSFLAFVCSCVIPFELGRRGRGRAKSDHVARPLMDEARLVRPAGESAQARAGNQANGVEIESKSQGINTAEALELTEGSTGADICGDDWEVIEKTEVHLTFEQAHKFMASVKCSKMNWKIDIEDKLEALRKVATEGPLPEPKRSWFSADANKGQQPGNMTPENAMQQYIDIVVSWLDGTHNL